MTKKLIASIILLAILIVGGILLASDNKDSNTSRNNPAQNESNTGTANQNITPGKVEITENKIFAPPQITVQKGAIVTWTNNDDIVHTVTNDLEGIGPSSSNIEPGKSYSYTFTNTGSYQYHCDIHPDMRGTIVVQ
jgi:plastocyanin